MKGIGTKRLTADHAPKYARVERDRRYLLRELPPGLKITDAHTQITDNYITGTRLRLRKVRVPATNEYTLKLTQKHAPDAPDAPDFARTLITSIYLNEYEYEVFSVFEGNELRKNRYPYEHEGRRYVVDVFLGMLHGLIFAETDFDTDEELRDFPAPVFAARDVTNDARFNGGSLAYQTIDQLRAAMQTQASVEK